MMHGCACKQYIFWSYNICFDATRFDGDPFTCQCKKEDKKAKGFEIWNFNGSFSNDTMAVKGLITTLGNFIDLRLQLSN